MQVYLNLIVTQETRYVNNASVKRRYPPAVEVLPTSGGVNISEQYFAV